MTIQDARTGQAVWVAATPSPKVARIGRGEGVITVTRNAAYESMACGLSPAADGGWWCSATPQSRGCRGFSNIASRQRHQGGFAARFRYLAVWRRVCRLRTRAAGYWQIHAHPRDPISTNRVVVQSPGNQSRHQSAVAHAGFYYAPVVVADAVDRRAMSRRIPEGALPAEIRHDPNKCVGARSY